MRNHRYGFNGIGDAYREQMRIYAMVWRNHRDDPPMGEWAIQRAIEMRGLAQQFYEKHEETVKLLKGEP